jgi:hypothetical protein
MLTVLVEQDSRRLDGNPFLIPFQESWLTNNTCRELLQIVLNEHLHLPDGLVTASEVKMYCMQQEESTSGSGRKARVNKDLANATACLDYTVMFVIESFFTNSFRFKIIPAEAERAAPSARAERVNPFHMMMHSQTNFTFLPPLLAHERMYANHCLYNELISFLEQNSLGWTSDMCSSVGKRFVDNMSKALFQCGPPVWNALNNKHNNGKACMFYFFLLVQMFCCFNRQCCCVSLMSLNYYAPLHMMLACFRCFC